MTDSNAEGRLKLMSALIAVEKVVLLLLELLADECQLTGMTDRQITAECKMLYVKDAVRQH